MGKGREGGSLVFGVGFSWVGLSVIDAVLVGSKPNDRAIFTVDFGIDLMILA